MPVIGTKFLLVCKHKEKNIKVRLIFPVLWYSVSNPEIILHEPLSAYQL